MDTTTEQQLKKIARSMQDINSSLRTLTQVIAVVAEKLEEANKEQADGTR